MPGRCGGSGVREPGGAVVICCVSLKGRSDAGSDRPRAGGVLVASEEGASGEPVEGLGWSYLVRERQAF